MQERDFEGIDFLLEHEEEIELEGNLHTGALLTFFDSGVDFGVNGTSSLSMALRQHIMMTSYQYSSGSYEKGVASPLLGQADDEIQSYLRRLPPVIRDTVFGDTVVDHDFLHRAYIGMVEVLIGETSGNISHYQQKIATVGDIREKDLLDSHRIQRELKAIGEQPLAPEDRPYREILQEQLHDEEDLLPALVLYRQELMRRLEEGKYVLTLPAVRAVE